MKNLVLSAIVAVTTLCSCHVNIDGLGDSRKIEPSDNIVQKAYPLDAFDTVDISVVASVKFVQTSGDDFRVALSAPENYIELFDIRVSDGELDIDFIRSNVNIEAKNVRMIIYAPTLRKLENSGVAQVRIDSLHTPSLKLENSGVGTIKAKGVTAQRVEVECSGVGNVEVEGTADEARLECSGVGSIHAAGLKTARVRAEVSGVGGIQCHATESVEGDVSGVGSLKYGGSPKTRRVQRSGVGKVSEL